MPQTTTTTSTTTRTTTTTTSTTRTTTTTTTTTGPRPAIALRTPTLIGGNSTSADFDDTVFPTSGTALKMPFPLYFYATSATAVFVAVNGIVGPSPTVSTYNNIALYDNLALKIRGEASLLTCNAVQIRAIFPLGPSRSGTTFTYTTRLIKGSSISLRVPPLIGLCPSNGMLRTTRRRPTMRISLSAFTRHYRAGSPMITST